MSIQNEVQEIIENAADWGWELETEQDCSDAAYNYRNDSGDCIVRFRVGRTGYCSLGRS